MLLIGRSSLYARHLGARSIRNARQGNVYLLLAFVGCLVVLLRSLVGAGYTEPVPSSRSVLTREEHHHLHLLSPPPHPPSPPDSSLLDFLRMRSQQEIKGIWKGMVQKEQEIEGNVAKMKGRLLSIYQHQHQPLQDHHDIDGDDNDTVAKDKNHEEEKGSTVEFKAALGTKWSEIKHRFEEMRRARGEKRGDMTHLERHLMNKDDVDEEPVRI